MSALDMFLGVASGITWTLAVTASSFALGAILGLPLCAMRVSGNVLLRYLAIGYIILFRSVPPLLWVFVFFFGLGSGYIPMSAFQGVVLGLCGRASERLRDSINHRCRGYNFQRELYRKNDLSRAHCICDCRAVLYHDQFAYSG